MNEETAFTAKPKKPKVDKNPGESAVGGVSVRAWLALEIVSTVCILMGATAYVCFKRHVEFSIPNEFWIMSSSVMIFYFAKQPQPVPPTSSSSSTTTVSETKIPPP